MAKTNQDKNQLEKKPEETNLAVAQLKNQIEQQKDQLAVLQQQLTQRGADEQKKAQEEAAKKADEEAQRLADEADIKKALGVVDQDKIESLTNRELINVVTEVIEKVVTAKDTQVQQQLDSKILELNDGIKVTQNAVMKMATAIDVKETRGNYSDFDEYQKEAAIIMQETPGMSVRNAYLLAKAQVLEKIPPKENLDRERPGTSISRSHIDRAAEAGERRRMQQEGASDKPRRSGVVNIRDIISTGIDKTIAARGE